MNRYLLKGTAVGALGGLLFGFDTAVIAGATHQLAQVYSLSPAQLGFTVAAALIGTVIGAMSAGMIGQKFGGRETLRVMAVLYVVSAVDRVSPGGGRACCWPGLHRRACPRSGAAAWLRMFQLNIVVGILLAYFSNFVIGQLHLGATEWLAARHRGRSGRALPHHALRHSPAGYRSQPFHLFSLILA